MENQAVAPRAVLFDAYGTLFDGDPWMLTVAVKRAGSSLRDVLDFFPV